ncbi:sh3 type 3 domain protein [Sphingobacterium deserti]|uniref:Sh3 type 3 domain protein n=2 Tax=Sphingobacterium deserti TaxID=1229276 RepID=A0A0B8SZD7_9SPHI|nr:sh3 type 3 domain protein [Sphingobacterium deserti]
MSQIAIVDSKEGYSNLRREASPNAEIITVLANNSAVIIDAMAMEHGEHNGWLKVFTGADPYCVRCTADLKEGYHLGYIHRSQVKNLEELEEVKSGSVFMRYNIVPFDPSTKKITYIDGSISTINGFSFYGADCGTPSTEINQAKAVINDQAITIPMRYIWNILHAQNNFRYFRQRDTVFVLQRVGDGACTTDVIWTFANQQLQQRLLGYSY